MLATKRCVTAILTPHPAEVKRVFASGSVGTLQPYIEVLAQFWRTMVIRQKIMCDLDFSDKLKPQDDKVKFKWYGPSNLKLRVATISSAAGFQLW